MATKSSIPVNKRKSIKMDERPCPLVQPLAIQLIKAPRGTMNHTYSDFSKCPAVEGYENTNKIEDMTFSQKVHHILSSPEQYDKWISWMPHGRAFKIHVSPQIPDFKYRIQWYLLTIASSSKHLSQVPTMFETHICPKYFGHKRYSSFLRALNNYGYKHISRGTDRNCKLTYKCHTCTDTMSIH